MKVINNTTGEIKYATYAANSSGNMRMWVDGKFYTDKQFNKTFSQIDPTGHYVKVLGKWQSIESIIKLAIKQLNQ